MSGAEVHDQAVFEAAPARLETGRRSPLWRLAGLTVAALCWICSLAACGLYAATILSPPEFWPVHLVLYGPRWLFAVPLLLLVPPALWFRLRWSFIPLSAAAYSVVAVSGMNIPWEKLLLPGGAPGERLRVLTCNVQSRDLRIRNLADYVAATQPDVLCFQECVLDDPLEALNLPGWQTRSMGEFCLVSRFPILEFEVVREPTRRHRSVGIRALLLRSGQRVPVFCVHIMSPRWGLQAVVDDPLRGTDSFRFVPPVQSIESATLRRKASEDFALAVIAGDFNLTAEHAIFARDWESCRDAFAWTGWGLGHTMFTRSVGLRIDHILCGPSWTPTRCEVGPDVGSAHRPVVADLAPTL